MELSLGNIPLLVCEGGVYANRGCVASAIGSVLIFVPEASREKLEPMHFSLNQELLNQELLD